MGINDLGLIHPLPYQNSDSLVIVLVKNMKVMVVIDCHGWLGTYMAMHS